MHVKSTIEVDHQLIRNLNQAWSKRATVCSIAKFETEAFDTTKTDYPESMIPFFNHPKFQCLDTQLKNEVATWGWIGYNERTIAAEDFIVNPAFSIIANSGLMGGDHAHFRKAMRQALVDEHYHTLMHLEAIERTKKDRNICKNLILPKAITYRRLESLHAKLVEPWHKELASIAFATVAEISVNAYLNLLANDKNIQKRNSLIAKLHNRDEYAHGKILMEVGKTIYVNMTTTQRKFFVKMLPEALKSFIAQDFSMWESILSQLNIPNTELIISETQEKESVIMRDYSGLYKFASEIDIINVIDFDFQNQ